MKRCKIPSGCKLPHRPCCADCEDKTCEKRCWNSPERCRCWEETPPPRQGRGRTYDWEEIARQMVLDDPVLRDAAARLAENRSVYQDYRERMDPITLPAARTVPPDIPAPLYRALEEALFAEAERKPALDSRLVCVVEYRGPGGRGLFRRKREVSLTQAAGLCLTPPNQTSRGAVRGPAPASRV